MVFTVATVQYKDERPLLLEEHLTSGTPPCFFPGPSGYGPTKEAPAAPSACQRPDWPDGGQHVLYHAAASALHNGSECGGAQGVLHGGTRCELWALMTAGLCLRSGSLQNGLGSCRVTAVACHDTYSRTMGDMAPRVTSTVVPRSRFSSAGYIPTAFK